VTGRGPARTLRHGSAMTRADLTRSGSPGERFGRMFGNLPVRDPGDEAIEAIVELTNRTSGINPAVPSGFTYLGQFIDHDITFDATSRLDRDNDPDVLVNLRTPRFDLDSVYGAGPRDQPFLYEWKKRDERGVKLLPNRPKGETGHLDLPRNPQGLALIGDARNDENRIVSQLHLLFTQFHNCVVDHLLDHERSPLEGHDLFEEARRIVRWHYQWIVVHDFMRRVGGPAAAKILVEGGVGQPPTVALEYFRSRDQPRIPVEFSAAAFRFGHSMVRPEYFIKPGETAVPLFRLDPEPDPDHPRPSLVGFRPLPESLAIEWDLFFFEGLHPDTKNHSLRIDGRLAEPLRSVPPDDEVLARLNLRRGRALGLPTGLDVASLMNERELKPGELLLGGSAMPDHVAAALHEATPLWWYILCEAASELGGGGGHLGPVGGRIVAEVLVGLLEADPQSYLRQWPAWTPRRLPAASERDFTMIDLVNFTRGRAPQPAVTPPAGAPPP